MADEEKVTTMEEDSSVGENTNNTKPVNENGTSVDGPDKGSDSATPDVTNLSNDVTATNDVSSQPNDQTNGTPDSPTDATNSTAENNAKETITATVETNKTDSSDVTSNDVSKTAAKNSSNSSNNDSSSNNANVKPSNDAAVNDVSSSGDAKKTEDDVTEAPCDVTDSRNSECASAKTSSKNGDKKQADKDKDTSVVAMDIEDSAPDDKCGCCPCSRAVVLAGVGVMVMVYLLALALGLGLGLRQDSGVKRKAVGAVAADHTECSQVGVDILAKGGTAVDSAIATLLCNGVRQPHSMGIGGGVFIAVYRKHPHTVEMFDGREVAPLAASHDGYLNKSFLFGNLSVAVPGEIQAYWEVHQKYGRLPWRELFQPAINMAANGHPLSNSTARALGILEDSFNVVLSDHPELCKMFCNEGVRKKQGDMVKMPALAQTLQGLAEQGPDYLYSNTSQAARDLIADVKAMGCLMTMEDLVQYRVVRDPPVSTSLGDLTLHTMTAPSGGPVLALVTKILHGLNMTSDDLHNVTTTAAILHKMVETFKYAYADRLKLGDPAFVNVTELLDKMLSPDYARKLRDAIDPQMTFNSSHYTDISAAPWREEGTTHISVVGPHGDAVAATSTINYYFGSLLISPSTGIILNNEMADFSTPEGPILDRLRPSSPNFIEPGKRPLSSMAPVIITDKDGNPQLVLGSSGGARITTSNAQVIARLLWLKQTLRDAIEAKRLHHQLYPNVLRYEQDYPQEIVDELAKYGHVMEMRPTYMAVVQAVSRDPDTGEIIAFSDPRKHANARILYEDELQH